MEEPEAQGKPIVETATRLAIERTRLAYERTMMAWVRTATSMITFGFTIYKFFQFEFQQGAPQVRSLIGPRLFALIMIGTGLVALILSTLQHYQNIRRLPVTKERVPWSLSALVAGLIAILGMLAWVSVLLRQ